MSLAEWMGQLLGPRPVQEIVITRYAGDQSMGDQINYQIEGMDGPVHPQDAYQLLAIVAGEVAKHIATQEAPSE